MFGEKIKTNYRYNYSVPSSACWLGGAEGRLRAAPLTTRVAKQPKAKQPHK